MTQETQRTGRSTRPAATRGGGNKTGGDELMRAKMDLVAAREHGEQGSLARLLQSHPHYALELAEFSAALVATTSYEREELTPATESIAARARARALAVVFPAEAAKSAKTIPAIASLKALRQARGVTAKALALRLGLGVDVLSGLEAGMIRVASVPERLLRSLGDALDATIEQVGLALQTQAAVAPALLRSTQGATVEGAEQPELDFAEAVRLSPGMTEDQKARWLAD